MPIYEYRCEACNRRLELFFRSYEQSQSPLCRQLRLRLPDPPRLPCHRGQVLGRQHGRPPATSATSMRTTLAPWSSG